MRYAPLHLALVIAAFGCGPTSNGGDSDGASGASCTAFDCDQLATCSSLSAPQCDGLCECYGERWRAGAAAAFSSCADQCTGVGDRYSNCIVDVSNQQPNFANPQYISNCEAKLSVCDAYPDDACNPVTLRLLSDQSFTDLQGCLGEPCDGTASTCVNQVLYCGVAPP